MSAAASPAIVRAVGKGAASIAGGEDRGSGWAELDRLAHGLVAAGRAAGLPYVAAQSDFGDPAPMADGDGRPYAAVLPWVEQGRDYWRNRKLALEASFVHAARLMAEPIWYAGGRLGSWRDTRLLDAIDCSCVTQDFGFSAALIAPAHLPAGQVGAVVWVATEPIDMAAAFARHAEPMFALALRFLATHAELASTRQRLAAAQLSRREVQCLRWVAAGKTTAETGTIMSLSVSTVRFHLRNAGEKLGATTRARLIQIATGHGFLGPDV